MSDTRHSFVGSAWRFALAGGLNTLVTGILLSMLSLVIDARVAYTVVFAAGIVLSAFLADHYIYGVRMGRAGIAVYVALYLLVYFIGLGAVHVWTTSGHSPAASGLVVLITAPLTFLGGRLITGHLHRSPRSTQSDNNPTVEAS